MAEMIVPDKWGHLALNRFVKYGFTYNCMAQWMLVQMAASKYEPFEHFFAMSPEELPPVTEVTDEILDEGLEMILGEYVERAEIPRLYVSDNLLLGVGIPRLRAEFGDTPVGSNQYGKAICRVLTRHAAKQ